MSENLEGNEPVMQPVAPPTVEPAEPLISPAQGAPRVARSVSSDPEESALPNGSTPTTSRPNVRRTPRARRMSLSLTRVDAWSVAKVTFMLSIAGAIIQIVAAALVWVMLDAVGVFGQITQIVSSTGLNTEGFDLKNVLSLTTVISGVTIFSIIEVVIATLLTTIISLLYNVVSTLVGGVHLTLGDD
ncbi:DUF3566 domain-containing protein [Bifidobacterium reuteri]|uniref:DUF3566 domain-containing protein n=1 Tax=Bifidobacterium reuteri TaxID=983706 RepID=A0A5J5E9J7_9BIFI|nr:MULTISPECIES: DUF3566 domain-containing protein [Bifidobacterium]KAA8825968.1 DUF3566 domain-containing protein [Bifidobacterium reuteri]TPF77904.1 membrane protein [Bifidobacterium sp. UTCIF-1]TPF79542.1 membrane protein [Bifidobacterium sp. UTCIF-24]TPF81659.1 membrane protein [Bifidobacterium sp. UTCIF-3]TPF83602.1 membrane protein [Bifidobacterium sp. UTCIF-36]